MLSVLVKVPGHQPEPNPSWYSALRLKVLGVAGAPPPPPPSLIGGDFKPHLEKEAQRDSLGLASEAFMAVLLYTCLMAQV